MTLEKLPKFELYEEGSQIRKSSKSVKSTIVEGYGRRRYKQEYIRFLTFAIASNDETLDHLENLYETGSLQDKELFENLHDRIEILGKKLNEGSGCFIRHAREGGHPVCCAPNFLDSCLRRNDGL
jgi:four helix bundle protein